MDVGSRFLFKGYLLLWLAFRGFTLGTRLIFDAGLQSVAWLALGVIGFIPVIGFVFAKPVLRPPVWQAWLVFLVGWALVDRSFYAAWFMNEPFDGELVGLLMAVPALVATLLYARPSFRAWQREAEMNVAG